MSSRESFPCFMFYTAGLKVDYCLCLIVFFYWCLITSSLTHWTLISGFYVLLWSQCRQINRLMVSKEGFSHSAHLLDVFSLHELLISLETGCPLIKNWLEAWRILAPWATDLIQTSGLCHPLPITVPPSVFIQTWSQSNNKTTKMFFLFLHSSFPCFSPTNKLCF